MPHDPTRDVDTPERPVVIVCDASGDRARHVTDAIAPVGACVLVPHVVATNEAALPPEASVALVAVDSSGTAGEVRSVIRLLTAKRVRVIVYAEHADAWSLGVRCSVLLSGARAVVDTSKSGFLQELNAKVGQALATEAAKRLEQEHLRLTFGRLGLIGHGDAMLKVFRWAIRVGGLSDLHVLITGETGTGKQLLAEAVHSLDPKRRNGPFVSLNCGAISPGLAESELFGHRRGAFTGADRDRPGLIRASQGGVLFLDEIAEMDPVLQAKMLRVLQHGRVLGVGTDQEVPVSLRVIAATNRNLDDMIQHRTFRADLFHRLNVLSIHIPPVRERTSDIEPLVRHFLVKHGHLRPGSSFAASDEFVTALAQDGLAGNARQLENLVRRAIVEKEDDGPLALADLPPEIWEHVSKGDAGVPGADAQESPATASTELAAVDDAEYLSRVLENNGWNLSRTLASCERSLVEAALQKAEGNQSRTARLLGITPRSVYNKLRKHRLANTLSTSRPDVPERSYRSKRAR